MNRPSEKALKVGEELLDHVAYGLTRNDTIKELAEMVDESNADLLAAINALLADAQRNGGVPAAFHVANLRSVLAGYDPLPPLPDSQGELSGLGPAQPRLL